MGWFDQECCKSIQTLTSVFNFIGIQDYPRKRKGLYQRQGTWQGFIMHTAYVIDGIIPQDKWFKLNFIIEEMIILTSQNTDRLDHGTLLLQRGFLVFCTRSYLFLNTYLK